MDWSEVTSTINKMYLQIALIGFAMTIAAFFLAISLSRNVLETIENMYNKLNSLSLKILTTQENERKRISTNIHDGLGQILTVIKWKIDSFSSTEPNNNFNPENLSEIKNLINNGIKEIRNISNDIKPLEIELNGTFNAIEENIQNISKISPIQFEFQFDETLKNKKFIEGQDINLYRLSQEFIQNAIKHSQATQVKINFKDEKNCLVILYHDNGIGMANPSRLPENINYRSNLMGANLELINNKPGNLFFKIIIKFSKIFYE
jgi:signal transduction histidine kinase